MGAYSIVFEGKNKPTGGPNSETGNLLLWIVNYFSDISRPEDNLKISKSNRNIERTGENTHINF